MAKMRRFEMQIPVELDEALEAGRGFDSKSGFARRILLGALGVAEPVEVKGSQEGPVPGVVKGVRPRPAPAVTRAAGGSRVHESPSIGRFGGGRG